MVAGRPDLCEWWVSAEREGVPLDSPTGRAEPEHFVFVALSVEAFMYRWWVENTLWRKLVDPEYHYHDPTPLTPVEEAYTDFYRRNPTPGAAET